MACIVVRVKPNGEKQVDVNGVQGPSCLSKIQGLIAGRQVVDQVLKPEYHASDIEVVQSESMSQ